MHFEDWKGSDAIRLLQRYRERYCVFNDDIQGTAGVALAGLLTALKIKGERLADQRILVRRCGVCGYRYCADTGAGDAAGGSGRAGRTR
ncbi:malic enzyme-like NAD(P)-binding protein [Rouxiella chamberiensis]|uniref:Malic enzyme NAD-binding domain-containing protein n=1 Tax=Rouxiella chamberiensis TaxID=1513468 RepID=A0ABY7HU66_9GAMM|nr:malic enzyme-like NAD(P)-binding protein [Rouxiella chamberiensis]WAT02961.1 hypothetical protein O1V66_02410 [Rouxiella chamberiensis]